MKFNLIKAITFIFILFSLNASAQVEGFWGVTKVSMGDQSMTPVAKWFKINKDGTYQMGNGWLQNGEGTWTFKNNMFQPTETAGDLIDDDFGAFAIKFADNKMYMEREEEGAMVTVTLEKITKIPMAPANQMQGVWDLEKIEKSGEDVTSSYDPDSKYYIFLRWDRSYRERDAQGNRNRGLWTINGHRSEITLVSDDRKQKDERWNLSFEGNKMIWEGSSDGNREVKMVYNRINEFPR